MVTILASAVRTVSGSGVVSTLPHPERAKALKFILDVTAAATAGGDTLDVYIQHTYDGTNYTDLVHFTQVLGNGGVKVFIAEWTREVTPETELRAPTDATLAAGVLQGGVIGSTLRVKWVIAGATQSFTFNVKADVQR